MGTLDAQTFLAKLNRVLRTADHDETLPTLTGVQMTLEGETLAMAATDRYRFAVAEVPATATVQPLEKPLTALIPAGILSPLAKRLKSYEGARGHRHHRERRGPHRPGHPVDGAHRGPTWSARTTGIC
ncbi:hypothetical protein ACLB9X_10950 [Streptomyces sp. 5K101]|uniref:DNA polymerase III subunit beta family protein n=1 Tax=Streptomyces sp. 5K101 TaxID=3390037 RepID=UPI003975FA0D